MHAILQENPHHHCAIPDGAPAMRWLWSRRSENSQGQVLVIVALGFIVLLGFAGLVIDIGMADSTQRYERSVVDAASLAGAQQLQLAGSRQVGAAQYADARTVAMQNLVNEVARGASTPVCATGGSAPYAVDVVRCPIPNTPYRVSIRAPSPECISNGCDISRSVLVSVTRLNLTTTFARLFGQIWLGRQPGVGRRLAQHRDIRRDHAAAPEAREERRRRQRRRH